MAATPTQPTLRSFNLPLKGQLLLVCGKCQRKLRQGHDPENLRSLKKLLKRHAKSDPNPVRLHILKVPCLKMCPKNALTICTPTQAAQHQCSILRTPEDIAQLYADFSAETKAS